jgi:hypothetical protein
LICRRFLAAPPRCASRIVSPWCSHERTRSRFAAYAEQFGEASWELDALDPTVIVELIRAELENLIDVQTWNEALSKETANRATLGEASKNWAEVEKYLRREARNV